MKKSMKYGNIINIKAIKKGENMTELEKSQEIIKYISNSTRKTPVKLFTSEKIEGNYDVKILGNDLKLVIGEWSEIEKIIKENDLKEYHLESDRRNSAIPMLDIKNINARIEPGAIIRDKVIIEDKAVIMMGAIINIGAEIGEGTMIDMGAILGGRAKVGKYCHIGANTVLAGVIEPPSADPVVVEDNVVIGANAVVLEGVRIGKGSVVAAGAVVTENVEPGVVVAGMPAKVIKIIDDKTKAKTEIIKDLRK